MNILSELIKATEYNSKLQTTSLLGQTETYSFFWNPSISLDDIKKFETKTKVKLPTDYKDFLLVSNGGVIYNIESENSGYRLLGLNEIEQLTEELKEYGYEIPNGWYCFMECLFSDDVMFFDLSNNARIIDGDMGYPIDEWNTINGSFRTFMTRMYQCNGAMFWRW